MSPSATPTLLDLAQLLETAGGGDRYRTAPATARWLTRQSPRARELCEQLHTGKAGEPTPFELAQLLCAITSHDSCPQAQGTALWLIARSPAASEAHTCLERLAEATGRAPIKPGHATSVLDLDTELDRLVAARDDWRDPDDVLDPTRNVGMDYTALQRLCEARLEQCDERDRADLEKVRDKLRRPAEVERLLPDNGRRFERLEEWVRQLHDVESAITSLEELARALRSTRNEDPADSGA